MAEEFIITEEFKRKFMEIQEGLLVLCIEVTDEKADKIYAYASMEKYSTSFNAFFEIGGRTGTLDEFDIDDELSSEFLRTGTYDLLDLRELCEEYNIPHPTQIKMNYNVTTGKFSASYEYDPICTLETGLDVSDVFMAWYNEIKTKTGT